MNIELCAGTIKAIDYAQSSARVDRIELCQSLELGGITPSGGMIKYAQSVGVETHVLIRPRPGGFVYSNSELQIISDDITLCRDLNVQGVVVGSLTDDFELNYSSLKKMVEVGEGLSFTFHRGFDDLTNWKDSLETLISLGFKRVLTSGQTKNVDKGLERLIQMKEFVDGAIEIMPGGGVKSSNIPRIIRQMHPTSIHFSGTSKKQLDKNSMFAEETLELDVKKVEQIINAVDLA